MLKLSRMRDVLSLLLCCSGVVASLCAETVDVTAKVVVTHTGDRSAKSVNSAGVVVWLTPVEPTANVSPRPGHYRLTQKDKQFTPHLLVVPTGSSVDFPNLDPFFHNVFSLFNGKRFDLGLYESGSSRTVHFNHDGVSYIFCNIHPEMSAVVLSLPTPHYDVSTAEGTVTLPGVPPASYDLHVWVEGANAQDLQALSRRIVVTAADKDLGTIEVRVDAHTHPHKNKFGDDYHPVPDSTY